MKYSEGKIGRVFVIRLEDGDTMPEVIESFAQENDVRGGMCMLIGGIKGGKIVVGPENSESIPVVPIILGLEGVHEICAVGTIFPDNDARPRLHMHAALGRAEKTISGCIRPGIEVWKLGEVILLEIVNNNAHREDTAAGFQMLAP